MKIYHFIPREECDIHEADSGCLCEPQFEEKGSEFWQGIFLGHEIFQHNFFSPLDRTPSSDDFVAVADENWDRSFA